MHEQISDIQGRYLGIPYDWRFPNMRRISGRLWNPGGPVFGPKAFGWGWTLNFARPATWALLGGILAACWLIFG